MGIELASRSARVDTVVALVQELTAEELSELADCLAALMAASDSRSRVSAAIQRVVESHRDVLAALGE